MVEGKEEKRVVKRCPNCYLDVHGLGLVKVNVRMQRLYVKGIKRVFGKRSTVWLKVGWVCPNCGYIELEKDKFPFKRFRHPIKCEVKS
jgi:ribosomal protein S27AE